jgi:hypothetical protein
MKNFNTIQEAEQAAKEYFVQICSYVGELKHRNNKGIIEIYMAHTIDIIFHCTIFASEPLKRPVGRPKGPEKVYIGFKIEPKYHAEVKALVKKYIADKNN